jgi:thiol-disulfide isomerase/thioredoxin/tetratricopeptide (TPR) repeat protein
LIGAAVLFAAACWAGTAEAELWVEQAKVALREERPLEARAHALAAVRDSPDVWSAYRVYLRASAAAGIPERAEADFADIRTSDPVAAVVWTWWRVNAGEAPLSDLEVLAAGEGTPASLALAYATVRQSDGADVSGWLFGDDSSMATRLRIRVLRDAGQAAAGARLARDWLSRHPDRPDVMSEIWPGLGQDAERRHQAAALRSVTKRLPENWEKPLFLFRALRMYAAAKDRDQSLRVAARIRELGFVPPLHRPPWNPSMQRAMGRTLAMTASAELPQASTSERLEITRARAHHLLARDRADEALAAWEELRERDDSYAAALAQTELLAEQGQLESALGSINDAVTLAVSPAVDDVARMDIARQSVELGHALGRRAEIAEVLGRDGEADRALAALLAPHPRWGEPSKGTDVPTLLALIGTLKSEPVLLWSTVATLLVPEDATFYVLRGRAQASQGHLDAAFASFARADALGTEVGEGMRQTYVGLASPITAAMAVSSRQAEILGAFADRRAALYPTEGLPDLALISPAPSTLAENRPRVGRTFPQWGADGDTGRLESSELRGHVYVLALWASWCGPCREELPDISAVVDRLKTEGLLVRGVAISTDADLAAFQRFRRREVWEGLDVGRRPELAQQLRVQSLPTTWVVAPDGTLVYQQIGYDPDFASVLEQILRKHAP